VHGATLGAIDPEDVMNERSVRRLLMPGRLLALSAAFWLTGAMHASAALPQGEWLSTGLPITSSTATLLVLADGSPLLIDRFTGATQQYHYDTAAWTASGSFGRPAHGDTFTPLPSGLVLIISGSADGTAALYNPATGVLTPTGAMHFARSGHRATLLASGKVLVSASGRTRTITWSAQLRSTMHARGRGVSRVS
jgi:hypothetical protein